MEKHPEIQFLPKEEIKKYQEGRLKEALEYVWNKSPYYRNIYTQKGIDINRIRTLEDLCQLPVTTKSDLQLHGNEFRCVAPEDIIDYATTSGTLGDPVTFTETEEDLCHLAYNEQLSFQTAGCTKQDILQEMVTIDRRFMAGLAYFLGARELGMGVVRVGNGIPELQWDTINRIHPTVGMAVPSFLVKLISFAEEHGIDYRNSSMKKCVCIGEALRDPKTFELNTLGQIIHDKWPELQLYTTYASTEMQHSFTDCEYFNGGHLQPELMIVEFLDDDNNPVAPGEAGEVTITTLGRKKQMIKFKGTTLYPPALFDILDNIPDVKNYVVEVFTNELGTDDVLVRVGTLTPGERFEKAIKDIFRAKVRVAPGVIFDTPENVSKIMFPPMSRKPVKFIDKRSH